LVDLAVMIADGGEVIRNIATLVHQPAVFGPVASDSTCWRTLKQIDSALLASIAAGRAAAREVVWVQRAEATGVLLPAVQVAGLPLLDRHGRAVLVIDLTRRSSFVTAKSKALQQLSNTFGYHPLLATRWPPRYRRHRPDRLPSPTRTTHQPGPQAGPANRQHRLGSCPVGKQQRGHRQTQPIDQGQP
jgi:hypothetical protein